MSTKVYVFWACLIALIAAVVVGVGFALWHDPLLIIPGLFPGLFIVYHRQKLIQWILRKVPHPEPDWERETKDLICVGLTIFAGVAYAVADEMNKQQKQQQKEARRWQALRREQERREEERSEVRIQNDQEPCDSIRPTRDFVQMLGDVEQQSEHAEKLAREGQAQEAVKQRLQSLKQEQELREQERREEERREQERLQEERREELIRKDRERREQERLRTLQREQQQQKEAAKKRNEQQEEARREQKRREQERREQERLKKLAEEDQERREQERLQKLIKKDQERREQQRLQTLQREQQQKEAAKKQKQQQQEEARREQKRLEQERREQERLKKLVEEDRERREQERLQRLIREQREKKAASAKASEQQPQLQLAVPGTKSQQQKKQQQPSASTTTTATTTSSPSGPTATIFTMQGLIALIQELQECPWYVQEDGSITRSVIETELINRPSGIDARVIKREVGTLLEQAESEGRVQLQSRADTITGDSTSVRLTAEGGGGTTSGVGSSTVSPPAKIEAQPHAAAELSDTAEAKKYRGACETWMKTGACRAGERCHFYHPDEDEYESFFYSEAVRAAAPSHCDQSPPPSRPPPSSTNKKVNAQEERKTQTTSQQNKEEEEAFKAKQSRKQAKKLAVQQEASSSSAPPAAAPKQKTNNNKAVSTERERVSFICSACERQKSAKDFTPSQLVKLDHKRTCIDCETERQGLPSSVWCNNCKRDLPAPAFYSDHLKVHSNNERVCRNCNDTFLALVRHEVVLRSELEAERDREALLLLNVQRPWFCETCEEHKIGSGQFSCFERMHEVLDHFDSATSSSSKNQQQRRTTKLGHGQRRVCTTCVEEERSRRVEEQIAAKRAAAEEERRARLERRRDDRARAAEVIWPEYTACECGDHLLAHSPNA